MAKVRRFAVAGLTLPSLCEGYPHYPYVPRCPICLAYGSYGYAG